MKENRTAIIRNSIVENDDSALTPAELELKEQCLFAFKLMVDGEKTKGEVVKALMEEYGIRNTVTAYGRIRMAGEWFGDSVKANRQVEAHIQYMRAEAIYKKAMDNEDLETALKAVDTMAKIRGLDKEDLSGIDPSKLEPHTYEVQLDPRMAAFVTSLLQMGRVNLTEALGDVPEAEVVPTTETAAQ